MGVEMLGNYGLVDRRIGSFFSRKLVVDCQAGKSFIIERDQKGVKNHLAKEP
jgi:hypothetical protein